MGIVTASQLLARLKSIDIKREYQDAFNKEAYYAEDLNIMQLNAGLGGARPMPPYSIVSVIKYGKPQGGIRLYDSGDFQKGIKYKAEGDSIKAFSTDRKNDFLEDMYDYYKPLSLNRRSKEEMNDQVLVKMNESIRKKTGLK